MKIMNIKFTALVLASAAFVGGVSAIDSIKSFNWETGLALTGQIGAMSLIQKKSEDFDPAISLIAQPIVATTLFMLRGNELARMPNRDDFIKGFSQDHKDYDKDKTSDQREEWLEKIEKRYSRNGYFAGALGAHVLILKAKNKAEQEGYNANFLSAKCDTVLPSSISPYAKSFVLTASPLLSAASPVFEAMVIHATGRLAAEILVGVCTMSLNRPGL